jgi:hypothetical protein
MARGIGWLAKDLKREIENARAEAGPKIVVSLKEQGPWWTGTFGRNWELSSQPLKPTKEREGGINDRTRRDTSPPAALKLPLDSPLYIGNTVEYAGFAVNNPLAIREGVTYEEHGQRFQLTAKYQNPDWFKVYTETEEILGDISNVFVARGFKRAV